MTLSPQISLGDRYRLVAPIAIGGMGEVWRADDQLLGRPVAVKVLRWEHADDGSFLTRFRAEARHTANLSHPGIANVYDYGEVGDTAFLVMELVEGESLSVLLAREGRLPVDRTLDIVGQAGLALQAAHEAGVVHRDVKPGNLLVRPDGAVKVTDFGIARTAGSSSVTQTGMVVGTAYYLSPEQGAGREVTPASDIYSLGVVAYECLAGWRPFAGDNPFSIAAAHVHEDPPPLPADVPQPVRDLVGAALAKSPADRPAPAGEFARRAFDLRDAVRADSLPREGRGFEPVSSAGAPTRPHPARPGGPASSRRLPFGRVLLAALGVVLLGTFGLRACDTPPRRAAAAKPSATAAAIVTVNAAGRLGRPHPEVGPGLRELGQRVRRTAAAGLRAGTVRGASPTDPVPSNAGGQRGKGGKGKGEGR